MRSAVAAASAVKLWYQTVELNQGARCVLTLLVPMIRNAPVDKSAERTLRHACLMLSYVRHRAQRISAARQRIFATIQVTVGHGPAPSVLPTTRVRAERASSQVARRITIAQAATALQCFQAPEPVLGRSEVAE